MTHLLPPHGVDLNISQHSSISQALDLSQHQQGPQMGQQGADAPATPSNGGPTGARKRKKTNGDVEDGGGQSEPRRLRRSHEACARCRNKKIKASPAGRHRLSIGKFPNIRLSFLSSAIQNIQNVQLALPQVSCATRKTGTGRPSHPAATQKKSSARSSNAPPCSRSSSRRSTSMTSTTRLPGKASTLMLRL